MMSNDTVSTRTGALISASERLVSHPDIASQIMSYSDTATLVKCLRVSRSYFDIAGELLYETVRVTRKNEEKVILGLFRPDNNTKAVLFEKIKTLQLGNLLLLSTQGISPAQLPRVQVLIIDTLLQWPGPDARCGTCLALRPTFVIVHGVIYTELTWDIEVRWWHCIKAVLENAKMVSITIWGGVHRTGRPLQDTTQFRTHAMVRYFFPDYAWYDREIDWIGLLTDLCKSVKSEIEFVNFDRNHDPCRTPSEMADILKNITQSTANVFRDLPDQEPPKIKFTTKAQYFDATNGRMQDLSPKLRERWIKDIRKEIRNKAKRQTESRTNEENESERESENDSESESGSESESESGSESKGQSESKSGSERESESESERESGSESKGQSESKSGSESESESESENQDDSEEESENDGLTENEVKTENDN
ncbi:hypothetical protein P7C73_g26, partial [Tremellales sp. Uapishka_1]